jgi:GAF domain-containing protein
LPPTLSKALGPFTVPDPIAAQVAARLFEHLAVSRVVFGEIAGDTLHVQQDYVRGVPSIVGEYSLEPFSPSFRASYKAGAIIQLDDVDADPRLNEAARTALRERQIAAFTDFVLCEEEGQVVLLALQSATPRAWTSREVDLIREVGEGVRSAMKTSTRRNNAP